MPFQIENRHTKITSSKEAVELLCRTLTDSDFYYDSVHETEEDGFWDNIIVFCDKWNIPFDQNLFNGISIAAHGQQEEGWDSSGCY